MRELFRVRGVVKMPQKSYYSRSLFFAQKKIAEILIARERVVRYTTMNRISENSTLLLP
jgi:hypothetical protein